MPKANESLHVFAMEVKKLVQLTFQGENHPLIDNFMTETLVNGICDSEIKLAVYFTQKTTFAETRTRALVLETACTIFRPQVSKVRKMETVEEVECLLNKFKEMFWEKTEENLKRHVKGPDPSYHQIMIRGQITNHLR